MNNLLTDLLILEQCQDVGFVHGICFPNAGKSFKLKNNTLLPYITGISYLPVYTDDHTAVK